MEQSLSSLAFKGSVAEAIAEAKQEKKLFLVYIAGDNQESKHLDTSTWIHPSVSDTLAKYCILLHILEGSSEASNFSAIYPQNSVPCITAIGYNGVRLWQKEGFVAADVLASSLEKAWLSLHVQETTAALLTAALASNKQSASETSEISSPGQEPQGTHASSPVTINQIPSSPDAGQSFRPERMEERNSHEVLAKEADTKVLHKPSHARADTKLDESTSKTKTGNTSSDPVEKSKNSHEVAYPLPGKNLEFSDHNLGSCSEVSRGVTNEASDMGQSTTDETIDFGEACASDFSAIKSNDVFLNIRLPNGVSLQVKFLVTDTLKMVKDYIHDNQTSSLDSFDLAIPYPRKVFTNQDLDSTLSELGLSNRQALVVVPHKQNNSHYGGGSSSYQQTYSSNDAGSPNGSEGYWAYLRRTLSYANPFSYYSWVAGSPSSAQESQSGIWQYGPNPSLQSNVRDTARPSTISSSEHTLPESGSRRRQQSSRFGGNIHTLKHEEDDGRFNDRNAFWNGNSTQFGGDNDGK